MTFKVAVKCQLKLNLKLQLKVTVFMEHFLLTVTTKNLINEGSFTFHFLREKRSTQHSSSMSQARDTSTQRKQLKISMSTYLK